MKKYMLSVPKINPEKLKRELIKKGKNFYEKVNDYIKNSTTFYPMLFLTAKAVLNDEEKKIKKIKKSLKNLEITSETKNILEKATKLEEDFSNYILSLYQRFNKVFDYNKTTEERTAILFSIISINDDIMKTIDYYKNNFNIDIDKVKIEPFDYSRFEELEKEINKALEIQKQRKEKELTIKQPGKNINLDMPGIS